MININILIVLFGLTLIVDYCFANKEGEAVLERELLKGYSIDSNSISASDEGTSDVGKSVAFAKKYTMPIIIICALIYYPILNILKKKATNIFSKTNENC